MSNQFCARCGGAIPEDSAFCPNCGERVAQTAQPQQPQYQQPAYQQPVYQQPVYQQTANVGPQPNLLVFGILSLVFDWIFVGIILGAIGRSKGKAYIAQGGQLTGASKVGFILCKVGLILSIIGTVAFAIWVIAAIAGGAATIRYYY
ncbi:MAG: zinc ribbon domain-containing protein [Clostridia bacterium]|nr:zinc ribbon domain-containing protein [Clostridia bacterium]